MIIDDFIPTPSQPLSVVKEDPILLKASRHMDSCGIPASIPVGIANHSHEKGFSPADAALVRAGQTSSESRDNLRETSSFVKDSLVQTLTNRFEAERTLREVMTMVKEENGRTRELIQNYYSAGVAAELAEAKAAANQANLLSVIKDLVKKV